MLIFKNFLSCTQLRRFSTGDLKTWYSKLVKKPHPKPPYVHVVQLGDPVLRQHCESVPLDKIGSKNLEDLIKNLKFVKTKYDCVGISAPQIGVALQVFVIEFNLDHARHFVKTEAQLKEVQLLPETVVINPKLKISDFNKSKDTELCASVKGFSADVPRFNAVIVDALNEKGDEIHLDLKGHVARVAQHEIDHLNGKLYTDIMDRHSFSCTCWQVVNEWRGKVELPFHR